jgi:hypothetical protein
MVYRRENQGEIGCGSSTNYRVITGFPMDDVLVGVGSYYPSPHIVPLCTTLGKMDK